MTQSTKWGIISAKGGVAESGGTQTRAPKYQPETLTQDNQKVEPPIHWFQKRETKAPRTPRIAPRALFWFAFYAFLADFQGGRDAVAKGTAYNNYLLTNVMGVVAAHNPCQGGGGVEHKETSTARPAPKRVPHRVPKPMKQAFQIRVRRSRAGNDHNSTPIIARGDGLQVCSPLPKEVGDRNFWIPLPTRKLYLRLWDSGPL